MIFLAACSGKAPVTLQKDAALSLPETAHLEALRAELASSKEFYLELSIRDKELRLCHSGTFVRKYKIENASMQERRFLFAGAGRVKRWNNKIWRDGKFSPERNVERIRIIPGDESTRPTPGKPGILPPTMEELIQVPYSFDLAFPAGFSLSFDLEGTIPGKAPKGKKKSHAWNDFLIGLGVRKGPSTRLMIVMDAKEGAAFFRSCPLNSPLLILP